MLLMCDFLPDGKAITSSPLRTTPEATLPQKPRKLRLGRRTYCTGKRKSCRLWSLPMCTVSRKSSKAGPVYHGVRADFSTTLSPSKADRGMHVTSGTPSGSMNLRYSATIALNRSSEKSTRSILFTASTTCLMPSKETRNVWRRVCVMTPRRASTRMIARLAVEPPVIMLRVYCSCPGVSAMMNLRLLVEK